MSGHALSRTLMRHYLYYWHDFSVVLRRNDVQKSSAMCLKAQKKLEQDLTLGYGFQVHVIFLTLGRVNKDAKNTN